MDIFLKLKNMNILLVDDDEWIRDSLSVYFESEGCRISAHETAEKALAEIDHHKVDVIITDYKLPGMDGIAFLKKVKKSHPHAVKILITAYASDSLANRARQAGAQELISKPFTSKTIEACLARLTADENVNAGQQKGIHDSTLSIKTGRQTN
ncbi:MAG: response regulator [Deltaproteobacteria bacterium]|nr:response regulator [Deltaproteobacteria bacterium]